MLTSPGLTNEDAADPDAAARRALRRHRTLATGLLLVMAGLTLGSYALPPGTLTDLLQASAKAGFVGGIADWFAVVALFRHPLGLPIPHTAILPNQKARLGQALGRFVGQHVITPEQVSAAVSRLDLPAYANRILSERQTVEMMARTLATLVPRLLAAMEDGRARRILARLLPRLVGGPGAGRIIASGLRGLVAGGRHQEVLTFILTQLKTTLAVKEEQLRLLIEERVREQGGRLIGWALGASIASRVLHSVNVELDQLGQEGSETGSDLRAAFDEWIRREITRMEEEPERAAEIGRAIRSVVTHETVQTWLADVWVRLRLAVEADAARPDGHTMAFLEGVSANLGTMIAGDDAARARLEAAIETLIARALPALRTQLATFIANVVTSWDTETITERLELRVGKDLQYVRVNGTLVGFLVGGLVYALLRATFGHVSF